MGQKYGKLNILKIVSYELYVAVILFVKRIVKF
jgi:hypothetical protein